ncbi:MAG TPA: 4-hydroxy-tetrahydrodipicolinate reductase [Caulobacteraceae bacterium]|jgi:4-hydroxy-tetrahydrodipicolinate reductase|nr:4-hydroxy-tetrahydrodipicolinate reductase [Caulobacteraceae bacterium]
MSGVVRIGIGGARGRMGVAVAELAGSHPRLMVSARFGAPGPAVDGLTSVDEALACSDVIVDFSTAAATAALATAAAGRGGPALVLGATGLDEAEDAAVRTAARTLPIVQSGNFSLGVNLLAGLVREAAGRLDAADWDIEIVEAHHRRKVDAPSGTALMLGEAAAAARGGAGRAAAREGITGARSNGDIGYAVVRGGGIVGEHSVIFAAEDEILTLSHSARDRRLFARGALAAALWVAGRPPGLYGMDDVLGLKS